MIQANTHRIVAINPGSRYLGIAVFDGLELLDWAVRSVPGKTIGEKKEAVTKLVRSLVGKSNCDFLAVKKLPAYRSSSVLDGLIDAIEQVPMQLKIGLHRYSLDQTKKALITRTRPNKKELINEVTVRYPFLFHEQAKEQKNRNPYFVRMFEAVAIGMLCAAEIESGCTTDKDRREKK